MITLLKKILKIFIALCIVGFMVVIGVVTLIDPNQFKARIQESVFAETGRVLSLNGPIYWQLDPAFSVEMQDVALHNTAPFSGEFLTIKKARIEAKLWSLISGKLLINIQCIGLNANLIRNRMGHSTWEGMHSLFSSPNKLPWLTLAVPYNIALENASVHWQDEDSNQHLIITDLAVSAKNLALGLAGLAAPITTNFQFEDLNRNHSGKIAAEGKAYFSEKLQKMHLKDIHLSANLANLPLATVRGECLIQNLSQSQEPMIEGTLETAGFSLQQWFTAFSPVNVTLPKLIDFKSTFKYQSPSLAVPTFLLSIEKNGTVEGSLIANVKGKTFKTLQASAALHGKTLTVANLPFTDIKTAFTATEGIFTFDKIDAESLHSQYQGKLEIDARSPTLQLVLSSQVKSFEANDLFTLLGAKDKLNGRLEGAINVHTHGNHAFEWMNNLRGEAQFSVSDGKVQGIELRPLLQHAQSTISLLTENTAKKQVVNVAALLTAELGEWRQQAEKSQQLSTPFRTLESHMVAENGKLNFSNVKLLHPDYTVSGQGVFSLAEQTIDFIAAGLLNAVSDAHSADVSKFLKDSPLAIRIKGPLQDLSIRPDLAHYAEGALKFVQETPMDKSTEETLEKLFGF